MYTIIICLCVESVACCFASVESLQDGNFSQANLLMLTSVCFSVVALLIGYTRNHLSKQD